MLSCERGLELDPDSVAARTGPMDLRINSGLHADSILNRMVEHARFLDIKGPNMREYTTRQKSGRKKGYWN